MKPKDPGSCFRENVIKCGEEKQTTNYYTSLTRILGYRQPLRPKKEYISTGCMILAEGCL
jgi:hypothetical protein